MELVSNYTGKDFRDVNERVFTWRDCREFEQNLEIPSGITRIDDNAFAGRCELEYVKIPESVIKIGDRAFAGCVNLFLGGNMVTPRYCIFDDLDGRWFSTLEPEKRFPYRFLAVWNAFCVDCREYGFFNAWNNLNP